MDDDKQIAHLSQIQTQWSMIFQAHQGSSDEAIAALEALMDRYGGAVHRYLLGVTRDPHLAADLAQDFALRFLRGDFRRADPRFGRFRNFVKTSVLNLVIDHHRRIKSRPQALSDGAMEVADSTDDLAELDRQFLACWREELLVRAWAELERHQEKSGQPFHTVLRHRADHPEQRSPDMAVDLTEKLGKEVNAGWVRQTLLRSREKYVALLVEEVARSLGHPSEAEVDEELMDLELWDFCRPGKKR